MATTTRDGGIRSLTGTRVAIPEPAAAAIARYVDRQLADNGADSDALVEELLGEPPEELLDTRGILERWDAGEISAEERERLYAIAERRWLATLAPAVRWRYAWQTFVYDALEGAASAARRAMSESLSSAISEYLADNPAPVGFRSAADVDAEYQELLGEAVGRRPSTVTSNVVDLMGWLEASVDAERKCRG